MTEEWGQNAILDGALESSISFKKRHSRGVA